MPATNQNQNIDTGYSLNTPEIIQNFLKFCNISCETQPYCTQVLLLYDHILFMMF